MIAAREAGAAAATACAAKAGATFTAQAKAEALAFLAGVEAASGEAITDVVKSRGVIPHDDRAFGAVYASLAKAGRIKAIGYVPRNKGHGTAGGRLWKLA
jgi:hypothetical protein